MSNLIPAALIIFGATLLAQPGPKPAALEILEIRGTIASVNLAPGGMPSIAVNTANGRQWNVRLGSIRYLIARDFNPKAGQSVVVRGFEQQGAGLVATSVECVQTRQKIVLRDSNGMPLWRGGAR
ncbi:MAG: hypothetical protein JNM66_30970 [Bryobacterales bacterium]|nr:hypothetical protein [Bryobacterales bacterium]